MKVFVFLTLVASTTAIWRWEGLPGSQGGFGQEGNNGLFGGIGDLLNPITGTLSQLLQVVSIISLEQRKVQQVLASLKNIVDQLSKLLGASLNDIKAIVSQLLNPGLTPDDKQNLVQNALKSVQEPIKSKAQQVATALIYVSDQLKSQSAAVQKAVSEIVALAFDQQFRQLPAQQQQAQLQNILKRLSQTDAQTVEKILEGFRGQIGNTNSQ